jgi:hypothetical protein
VIFMSSPSDQFDSVQKILRLKRYEQAPPRYFNEFSGRVIARIERGEGRSSWWERFGFDLRPALAAVTGAFACALVVYGVATAEDVEPADVSGMSSLATPSGATVGGPDLAATGGSSSGYSTNPVSSYGTPIDRNVFRAQLTPVSYPLR